MSRSIYDRLLSFLGDVESRKIAYTLSHPRPEAILITLAVPGERWEVEFLDDGSVDVERFVSTGEIEGDEVLDGLLARHADD